MRLSLFILLCLYSFTTNAQDLVPYSNNGLWGFFSTSRQQALEMKYQETGPFKGNIALVKKGNKWGAVNTELSVIIAPEYERIEFISKDLLRAAKAGRLDLFNAAGLRLFPESLREATVLRTDSSLLVVQNEAKKYGVITTKGQLFIPVRYAYAPEHITPEHLLIPEDSPTGPLFGILSKKGEEIIPFRFDIIQLKGDYTAGSDKKFFECIAPGGEVFLYDLNGKLLTSGNFDRIWTYGNLTLVEKNKKTGVRYKELPAIHWMDELSNYRDGFVIGLVDKKRCFVNPEGKLIMVPQYNEIYDFREGVGLVKKVNEEQGEERYGLIDRNGKELVPPVYYSINSWNNKYAAAQSMSYKTGLIELATKKTVLPFEYDRIILLQCGNLFVSQGYKAVMLDANFRQVPEAVFEEVYAPDYSNAALDNNLIRVRNRRKGKELFGLIDCKGKIVIPVEYNEISQVNDIYGRNPLNSIYKVVKRDSANDYHSGLMNKNGEFIIPLRRGGINYYSKKYIEVVGYEKMDGESRALRGIIDTAGRDIIPCVFDVIAVVDNGFSVMYNGRSGFYNEKGKQMIPPVYHSVVPLGREYFIVILWNKQGIFDIHGKQITEIKYEEVFKEGFENGVFKVKLKGKIIYVGKDGKEYVKQNE